MEKLLLTRKEAADALNISVFYTPEELKSYITKEICKC